MQVREGVRRLDEVLALAREVQACPALHLRGLATHHGRLEAFLPIVAAVRSNVSQARLPAPAKHLLHPVLSQLFCSTACFMVLLTSNTLHEAAACKYPWFFHMPFSLVCDQLKNHHSTLV